jgi:PAS domain S-box-containing protein
VLYGLSRVTIRSVNQASVAFYGARDEQHLLENAPWLLATVPLPVLKDVLVARWNGAVSFHMETHISTLDGKQIHGIVGISIPKAGDQPDLSRIILTFTDITERKRIEDALRESEQRLRMVMRASGTGWWDWDLKANVLRLDDQCKALLGVPLTVEVTYEVVREHLRPEDRSRLDQTLAIALAASGEYEVECAAEWPDGSIHWALLRGRSFHDAAGTPIRLMGVAVDINDRRLAEKKIRESEEFYRTLIETLPVTVVLANAKGVATYISPVAKEMFGIEPEERLGTVPTDWIAPEYHEVVRQRIREVMVELRPQPPIEYKIFKGDRTPVWGQVASAPFLDSEGHLAGVVTVCQDVTARKQAEEALRENEARLRLAQQAAHAGTWDLDLTTGHVVVSEEPADEGTRVFLFQAIRELLLNIVKHAQASSAHIVSTRQDEDRLRIVVSDTGRGFDLSRLANREPTKGFGLFNIRERLELIGGRLDVETSPGRGTAMSIDVPRGRIISPAGLTRQAVAAVSTAALDTSAAVAEPVPGQENVRVLVADDHRVVREGLITMLQEQPTIKVIGEAADGQQALDLALRMKPDVVLMDISMPVMDGIEATRRITEELPGIRVIGLSMHEQADMAAAMRSAGATDYFSKGTASDHLVEAILHQTAGLG